MRKYYEDRDMEIRVEIKKGKIRLNILYDIKSDQINTHGYDIELSDEQVWDLVSALYEKIKRKVNEEFFNNEEV